MTPDATCPRCGTVFLASALKPGPGPGPGTLACLACGGAIPLPPPEGDAP